MRDHPRPIRISTLITAVSLLLITLVGAGALYSWLADESCGPGVSQHGGECAGVSDGSYSFAGTLNSVTARINQENKRIKDSSHATIALMIPMTSDNQAEQRKILEEVQGAYLAQYRANHLSAAQTPAIRLVLANPGRGYAYWQPVADQLARMAASPGDNLRAVTGFDISLPTTKAAISYLTNGKGIPVVGGPITADDIANTAAAPHAFKGLARVAPTNSDEAAAIRNFNRTVDPAQTLVVEDTRDGDDYVATLRQTFEALAKGSPVEPETYDTSGGSTDVEGNTGNQFHQMIPAICVSNANVIYFAGRPLQLRQFVNELGRRTCADRRYTVISGSAASTVAVDEKFDWAALSRGVSLEYAGLAHPDAWTGPDTPTTGGSATGYHQLSDLAGQAGNDSIGGIGQVALADSRTIIAYDSVWTAVSAIRSTVDMPTLKDVADDWSRLHGPLKVDGASGWICLDNYGNPYDKALAIVQLQQDKSARFLGLAWPAGNPPAADCTAPGSGH